MLIAPIVRARSCRSPSCPSRFPTTTRTPRRCSSSSPSRSCCRSRSWLGPRLARPDRGRAERGGALRALAALLTGAARGRAPRRAGRLRRRPRRRRRPVVWLAVAALVLRRAAAPDAVAGRAIASRRWRQRLWIAAALPDRGGDPRVHARSARSRCRCSSSALVLVAARRARRRAIAVPAARPPARAGVADVVVAVLLLLAVPNLVIFGPEAAPAPPRCRPRSSSSTRTSSSGPPTRSSPATRCWSTRSRSTGSGRSTSSPASST